MIIGFKEFLRRQRLPLIKTVYVPDPKTEADTFDRLEEGKWIDGRYKGNIRIDQPTHGVGQQHAHVYGRNHNNELGVINLDGTASHGSQMRLHKKDIAALAARGFTVPEDGIVEWLAVKGEFLLLEG